MFVYVRNHRSATVASIFDRAFAGRFYVASNAAASSPKRRNEKGTRGIVLQPSRRNSTTTTVNTTTHTYLHSPYPPFPRFHAINDIYDYYSLSFSVSKSLYHSSTTVSLPVRRRSRQKASGVKLLNNSDATTTSVTTSCSATTEGNRPTDDAEYDPGTDSGGTLERLHSPISDPAIFSSFVNDLIDLLEEKLEPMKEKNEYFKTKLGNDEETGRPLYTIDLGPVEGTYTIEISYEECVFEYSSPISGKILYCLGSLHNEWISISDGHKFVGTLVRDLLRSNCIGLPKF